MRSRPGVAARQQQPQVLDDRADDVIIEVQQVQAPVSEQQVPRVEIAVDALHRDAVGDALVDVGEIIGGGRVAFAQRLGEHVIVQHPLQVIAHIGVRVQAHSMLGGPRRSDVVHPGGEHPQALDELVIELVGGPSSEARVEAVVDTLNLFEGVPVREGT